MKKYLVLIIVALTLVLAACSDSSTDGGKFPSQKIEIVAPATPGGGWDMTARTMQKAFQENDIIDENITVTNKPGGNGEVGWQYLSSKDAHHIAINSSLLVTNKLLGQSELTYESFTPLAILSTEWISVAVKQDSEIETAMDMLEKLKQDPASLNIAVAPGLGNNDHLSFVQAAKSYGVDVTKLNFMVYESGGDVVTALLGGHVDVATMAVSESKEQHLAGNLRMLAVTSDTKLEGLDDVPTWTELGIDMVFPHWRGVIGPPDMTEEEIAYWDEAISKMIESDTWAEVVANNGWTSFYKNSSEAKEFLAEQTEMYNQLLTDSGLIE